MGNFPSPPGGPSGVGSSTRYAAPANDGARPPALLLALLWALLVTALVSVAFGTRAWFGGEVNVPLHASVAGLCLFGSVVLLARLRLDLNRRRMAGNLVEHTLTSVRTNTVVALTSWVLGIANLALIALHFYAGGG
jgi:hypothetical protein